MHRFQSVQLHRLLAAIFSSRIRAPPDLRAVNGQNCKLRALALVGAGDPQFSVDPLDKRPNYRHSQPFADGGVEPFRQRRAVSSPRAPQRTGEYAAEGHGMEPFGQLAGVLLALLDQRNVGSTRMLAGKRPRVSPCRIR